MKRLLKNKKLTGQANTRKQFEFNLLLSIFDATIMEILNTINYQKAIICKMYQQTLEITSNEVQYKKFIE